MAGGWVDTRVSAAGTLSCHAVPKSGMARPTVYDSVGPDPKSSPHPSRPPSPYYQALEQPAVAGYSHPHPRYASPQQLPPPYHVPPAGGNPYPPPHTQQQSNVSHEYGQPAYPGWRGPYYNAHAQQSDSHPPPPCTIPYPPPHQSGYYKHQ